MPRGRLLPTRACEDARAQGEQLRLIGVVGTIAGVVDRLDPISTRERGIRPIGGSLGLGGVKIHIANRRVGGAVQSGRQRARARQRRERLICLPSRRQNTPLHDQRIAEDGMVWLEHVSIDRHRRLDPPLG